MKKPLKDDPEYWDGDIFLEELYHYDLKEYLCCREREDIVTGSQLGVTVYDKEDA